MKVIVFLDSNDRFKANYRHLPFWKLPHDEHGCNCFNAEIINGFLYYRNQKVLNMNELKMSIKRNKSNG